MTEFTEIEGGGVASALGFKAAGIHAGFRKEPGRGDLALVVADDVCAAAGMFTQNIFCSAPVIVSREHLSDGGAGAPSYGSARAVVINSGIANAATGEPGLEHAREMARITADTVGCTEDEVLVASTGVIGQHLPMEPFKTGVPAAFAACSREGGATAARAIMTTDTHPKEYAVSFSGDAIGYAGRTFTVGGMSKGSGMIMPNMATMIAVITTDAPIAAAHLSEILHSAVNVSFNKITVDSDTSNNDTCVTLASGAAAPGEGEFVPGTPAFEALAPRARDGRRRRGRHAPRHRERRRRGDRRRRRRMRAHDRELPAREDRHLRPRRQLGAHRRRGGALGRVVQSARRLHRHHGHSRVPGRAHRSLRRGRGPATFRGA